MFPNKFKTPKISSAIPKTGHPTKTNKMPNAKHPVALDFFGWRKYPVVRPGPIVMGTPAIKNKFPNLINVLLKNKLIPNMVKTSPAPKRDNPIFLFPYRRIPPTSGKLDNGDDDDLEYCFLERIKLERRRKRH